MPFLLFEGVSEKYLQEQFLCSAVTASLFQDLNNHSFPVRGVLITQPPSPESREEREPTLGSCRKSTGVPSHPLEVTGAKYGLPYTGQHSTRNQHRKQEKPMVFFMQNNPGIDKSSSLTSKISKIPLTPMFSG